MGQKFLSKVSIFYDDDEGFKKEKFPVIWEFLQQRPRFQNGFDFFQNNNLYKSRQLNKQYMKRFDLLR